uniref:Uncharacterized protein n=1 Tax=Glossina palpalis gambiensis TaxID=67801 RepID=A0A1B0BQ65_9MUSC
MARPQNIWEEMSNSIVHTYNGTSELMNVAGKLYIEPTEDYIENIVLLFAGCAIYVRHMYHCVRYSFDLEGRDLPVLLDNICVYEHINK